MEKPVERAIGTVSYCIHKSIKSTAKWRGYNLAQESYSRWAAREILTRLEKNPTVPPLITIEEFRDQMDKYSCLNLHTSYVFSCAKDMADWIIDLLIS